MNQLSSLTQQCKRVLPIGVNYSSQQVGPSNHFFHLISFDWKPDGTWEYSNNFTNQELSLLVPMPDDTPVAIEHLDVNDEKATLGVISDPSSNTHKSLHMLQSKA